eukprot:7379649-Prymnesium_polylepis.1
MVRRGGADGGQPLSRAAVESAFAGPMAKSSWSVSAATTSARPQVRTSSAVQKDLVESAGGASASATTR